MAGALGSNSLVGAFLLPRASVVSCRECLRRACCGLSATWDEPDLGPAKSCGGALTGPGGSDGLPMIE